ncbi:hypothetical protein EV44_g4173 [Erysiphe necator]|uniref:Reverse transcriptase domain-containing protein n=1 Tax=Uncinula necator TaxID=52586 RepID=A0A0B1PDN8_UNCNE|nr:hypothetical protein EV44_g4173 [Erysiphe necator]
MLYVSPLFKLDGLKNAFGYADDVAILETSNSLEMNSNKIGKVINQALEWGEREGLTFDRGKSELIHFTRRHRHKNYNPAIQTNEFRIEVNQRMS